MLRPKSTNGPILSFSVTPSLTQLYRNINLLSIGYAFQPHLRPRLTQSGRAFLWKPWASDGRDSHPSFRYSHRNSHFQPVHQSSRSGFNPVGTLAYHPYGSAASVICLAPVHFRRGSTRLVSYYALFKGWLLLSQPPSCLCTPTSFPT